MSPAGLLFLLLLGHVVLSLRSLRAYLLLTLLSLGGRRAHRTRSHTSHSLTHTHPAGGGAGQSSGQPLVSRPLHRRTDGYAGAANAEPAGISDAGRREPGCHHPTDRVRQRRCRRSAGCGCHRHGACGTQYVRKALAALVSLLSLPPGALRPSVPRRLPLPMLACDLRRAHFRKHAKHRGWVDFDDLLEGRLKRKLGLCTLGKHHLKDASSEYLVLAPLGSIN